MDIENKKDDSVPDDEARIASWLKSKVEQSRNIGYRTAFEQQWLTNCAYKLGYSGIYYDSNIRQFRNSDSRSLGLRRNRIHINKILPTLQNRLARLVKNRPKFKVKPNSNSSEDKDCARLGGHVLDSIWEKQKISLKYPEVLDWAQVIGHSYFKVSFDPMLGEMIQDPITFENEFEGDIRIDVVSGFEVFPDPYASSSEDLKWLIHAKVRPLDYFRDRYERGNEVKQEDVWLQSLGYENRVNNMSPAAQYSVGSSEDQRQKNCAIELVYYEARTKQYPNGRMIITANNILLEDKELPVGEIPFVKFDDILVAGRYYSEPITTHLRSIQDQYNRVIERRAKWTNLLLAGKYLAPKGAGLIQEALNDQSGEVIEYDPVPNAGAPQAMDVPSIPAYAYKEEESLEKDFNITAGLNEASQGMAPGGVTAKIALEFLQEQDLTRIGIMARRNELNMAQLFSLVLKYVGAFYKTPRLLKVAGSNQSYMVKSFQGADLKENYDVSVIEGSTLPESITMKRDYILTYFQMGLMGDPLNPETKEKVISMLEFGQLADTWEEQGLDMNQIKKKLEDIKAGIEPEVSEFDNHALTVKELNKFRKTNDYSELPEENKELLLKTIEEHLQKLVDLSVGPPQMEEPIMNAADSAPQGVIP